MNITNIILINNSTEDNNNSTEDNEEGKNNLYIIRAFNGKLKKLQKEEKTHLLNEIVNDICKKDFSFEDLATHIDQVKRFYIIRSYSLKNEYQNKSLSALTLETLEEVRIKLINDLKNQIKSIQDDNLKSNRNLTFFKLNKLQLQLDNSESQLYKILSDLIIHRFCSQSELAIFCYYIDNHPYTPPNTTKEKVITSEKSPKINCCRKFNLKSLLSHSMTTTTLRLRSSESNIAVCSLP